MESHLEARLWNDVFVLRAGRARHPARHDQGHGADRDDPRRVRDGRDPLRAARALRRASTAAAGTTSSASSRSSAPTRTSSCRPRAGHDGPRPSCAPTSQLLIKTCHRRGAHAMGGMAAQIPIKNDPEANEAALDKVRAGQAARSRRRPRRHLGRASRPGADRQGDVRRAHAEPEPDRRASARTSTSRRDDLLDWSPRARSPRRACAATSTSASSTSEPGCAATAACRSTT